jgi:hypothetical protein
LGAHFSFTFFNEEHPLQHSSTQQHSQRRASFRRQQTATMTQGIRLQVLSLLVLIGALLLTSSSAFVARSGRSSIAFVSSTQQQHCPFRSNSRAVLLFATDEESEQPQQRELTPTERILENEKLDPATRAVVEAAAKRNSASEDVEQKYPIDLPSPILLATSMVLAIASTGT